MSDQDIQKFGSQFPAVSGSAFATAREQVLKSGRSVLQSENGVIFEVFPDGRRVEVKKIAPQTHFKCRQHLHDQASATNPRMRMLAGPNGSGKSTLKRRHSGRTGIIDNRRRNSNAHLSRAASFSNDAANRFPAWSAA